MLAKTSRRAGGSVDGEDRHPVDEAKDVLAQAEVRARREQGGASCRDGVAQPLGQVALTGENPQQRPKEAVSGSDRADRLDRQTR